MITDTARPAARRGIANLRQVAERDDGLAVVRFRGREFAAPALALLTPGTSVYVVPSGPHGLAVFRERVPIDRRPLCLCTPAPRLDVADPAQLTL